MTLLDAFAAVLVCGLMGCRDAGSGVDASAEAGGCAVTGLVAWPEADGLFRKDALFLGADAAYSVDLGGQRVAWFFGDTFVAKGADRSRSNSTFIRNSVGIQSGSYDPSLASMTFAWQTNAGVASSFFPESGADWFWPLGGVRLASRLVLFLLEETAQGSGAFGFAAVRTKVVFVTNPDAAASGWTVTDGNLPAFSFPIAFGAAVVRDGAYVYAFGDQEPGDHSVYVARFDAAALDAGDASSPMFWTNGAWSPSTTVPDTIFPSSTALDNPPTEFSVQKRTDGTWLAVHSTGFGATQIAVRTAPAPQGPWTLPCKTFTPPDSSKPNVIVYAAKAHPELAGGSFIATYATNSTDLATVANDFTLYFPRFVRSH